MPADGRAVVVTPSVFGDGGGVERFARLLRGVLERDGWDVHLVAPGRPASAWRSRVCLGELSAARSAAEASNRLRPDLVVTNGFLGGPYFRAARRVHVYHGTMVEMTRSGDRDLSLPYRLRRAAGGGLAELASAWNARTVAVSDSAARELRRYYRVSVDAVIPNGVDTELFKPRDRQECRDKLGIEEARPLALFVGRSGGRKGLAIAAAACWEAGWGLLRAGEGPCPDGVRDLGVLTAEELAFAYAAADAVVFPTRYEACSYVVLEALACGVPLLTTNVGWMPSLLRAVPGYEAFLIGKGGEGLRSGLRRIGAGEDVATLCAAARDWVAQHNSLPSFAAAWLSFLGGQPSR